MRTIPSNLRRVVAWVAGADAHSVALAQSLAVSGPTQSPMSRGAGRWQFTGLDGYGVNRFGGATSPLQAFSGVARPVQHPQHTPLGMASGASNTALPSTGTGADVLAMMSPGYVSTGL